LFITMAKEGSTVGGLMDVVGTCVSMALQYGVPLITLVDKFRHARFEPAGMTTNKDIPFAKSVIDYIFCWLGCQFIPGYAQANTPNRTAMASGSENKNAATVRQVVEKTRDLAQKIAEVKSAKTPHDAIPNTKDAIPNTNDAIRNTQYAIRNTHDEKAVDGDNESRHREKVERFSNGADWGEDRSRRNAIRILDIDTGARSLGIANTLSKTEDITISAGTTELMPEEKQGDMPGQLQFEAVVMQQFNSQFEHFQDDAPCCDICGSITVRNGSCYKCFNCGNSMGCS
jgi:ribonucleoside-diphosphate reductase alpha chain